MSDQPQGHEPMGVSVRFAVMSGISLVLLVAVALLLMRPVYDWFTASRPTVSDLAVEPILPPKPSLQQHPAQDYDTYFAQQQAQLRSYGWVDRDKSIARIPIERAIDLTLKRKLPHRGKATVNKNN